VVAVAEAEAESRFWTNPSVRALASGRDPIADVIEKARALVFEAMENGWQGPPFDPFWLAQHRGLLVIPRDDIPDARLVPAEKGKAVIEYNPNQPRHRVRFSLAHEIGHTLFPDYLQTTHNRLQPVPQRRDEWQRELLCNLAAAEILMPSESIAREVASNITIENLTSLWKKFEVSPEAFLIRTARSTSQPISIFAAARTNDENDSPYRLDYCMASGSSEIKFAPGTLLPSNTALKECSAIGFTARGVERWGGTEVSVECVGIPPYPGSIFPRVIGVLRARDQLASELLDILYVRGDVTQPRGESNKIVAHIVNDKSSTWGAGAARAIGNRWISAHRDFKNWTIARREEFELGTVHSYEVSSDLTVVSMVAQHGFGDSSKPRIRYAALRGCLASLANIAVGQHASVHMPRIGTGFAGGNWRVIEDLIAETLIGRGIKVTVYDLPRGREGVQTFLDSALAAT